MDILGDRKFVEVPGEKTHELPPLLVRSTPHVKRTEHVVDVASRIVDSEEMLPPGMGVDPASVEAGMVEVDRRKWDLALNLVDQYFAFIKHWQWGDSILEWIRQCEMTFDSRIDLRNILRNDVWPHAGRSSFVMLLEDKAIQTRGVEIEKAVGMRLTFRQPPPMGCFSNQFLFYLNTVVANSAYTTWAGMTPAPVSSLPPERFTFQVVNMSLQ
jgi:hypothetical protein